MSEPMVEDHELNNETEKSDLIKVSSSFISKINFKIAAFLLLIGSIIFSDLFIKAISHIDGAVDGEQATTKGTVLQLLIFVMAYLVIDVLVQTDIL